MTLSPKYRIKQVVTHVLDGASYIVLGICVYSSRNYSYLCGASDGSTRYFKEFELDGDVRQNRLGFTFK